MAGSPRCENYRCFAVASVGKTIHFGGIFRGGIPRLRHLPRIVQYSEIRRVWTGQSPAGLFAAAGNAKAAVASKVSETCSSRTKAAGKRGRKRE
ncbi:hypothetical protein MMC29_005865, partial [Sticta canariensis]|nr:hypothetical protein [Sticta canariensis]